MNDGTFLNPGSRSRGGFLRPSLRKSGTMINANFSKMSASSPLPPSKSGKESPEGSSNSKSRPFGSTSNPGSMDENIDTEKLNIKKKQELENEKKKKKILVLQGKSLFIFGPKQWLRRLIGKIVTFRLFDSIILVVILISTVVMAYSTPLADPKGTKTFILTYVDYLITSIFTIECAMKIFVWGFVLNGKDSYMISNWNKMDFFIVIVSLVSIPMKDDGV